MNFLKEFRELESAEFGFFVFAACGSVCPGVLAIWLFNPGLIEASTTPKLVLLSLSFMWPYVGLNSWIIGLTNGAAPETPKNKIYIQLFLQSGVWSMFMFLGCLAARFFFGVSLGIFLIILAILEIFFLGHQKLKSQKTRLLHPSEPAEKK
jgi:hypothetical protein